MKINELNENGSRLKVYIRGYFYAIDLFRDFESKRELNDYMLNEFGVKPSQYTYCY